MLVLSTPGPVSIPNSERSHASAHELIDAEHRADDERDAEDDGGDQVARLQQDVAAPIGRDAEDVAHPATRVGDPADRRPDDRRERDEAGDAEHAGGARGDLPAPRRGDDARVADQSGDVAVDQLDHRVHRVRVAAEPQSGDREGDVDRREDREQRLVADAGPEQEPVVAAGSAATPGSGTRPAWPG